MNNRLSETLELCLQALEGGATVDECLARYPSLAGELRSLLETAAAARTVNLPAVPENAATRGRARVLAHAARLRGAGRPRPRFSGALRMAAALAALAVFVLVGNGLVAASAKALPGDSLYPMKRTIEDIRLRLAPNPEAESQVRQEISARRVEETEELLAGQRVEEVEFEGVIGQQLPEGWLVAGIPVRVTAQIELEGVLVVGAYVEVRGQTQTDGSVLAERIRVEEDEGEDDSPRQITSTPKAGETKSTEEEEPDSTPKPGKTDDNSSGRGSGGGGDDDSGGGSGSGSGDETPDPTGEENDDNEDDDG